MFNWNIINMHNLISKQLKHAFAETDSVDVINKDSSESLQISYY